MTQAPDALTITPGPLHGGRWSSYADHRMATAGAIIGLRIPGVVIDDIATTAKTLPGFEKMWMRMLNVAGSSAGGEQRLAAQSAGTDRGPGGEAAR